MYVIAFGVKRNSYFFSEKGRTYRENWITYDCYIIKQLFCNERLTIQESVKHIAEFTSGIWQIYPPSKLNTRATTVFIIKYLKAFSFQVCSEVFAANSWYFRNAFVRANYYNL